MKGMVMSIEPDIVYEAVGIVSNRKEAHSCCGCCCDIRRAVIVVDILLLIGRVLVMWGVELVQRIQLLLASFTVSDDTTDVIDDHDDKVVVAVSILLFHLLGVWCAALSLYGAITYNKYLVAANAIFSVLTMPFGGLLSLVVNGLYFYPHAFLIYYIDTGVITKETYVNEKQSCCCV